MTNLGLFSKMENVFHLENNKKSKIMKIWSCHLIHLWIFIGTSHFICFIHLNSTLRFSSRVTEPVTPDKMEVMHALASFFNFFFWNASSAHRNAGKRVVLWLLSYRCGDRRLEYARIGPEEGGGWALLVLVWHIFFFFLLKLS